MHFSCHCFFLFFFLFIDHLHRRRQEFQKDGVILSESGLQLIKSLEIEKEKRQMNDPKKKRFNRKMLAQMEPVVLPSRTDGDGLDLDGGKCTPICLFVSLIHFEKSFITNCVIYRQRPRRWGR